MKKFLGFDWVTQEQFSASQSKTRALIRERADRIEGILMSQQEQFDAQFNRVQTGVQELRDEVARLVNQPGAEHVDFSRLTELADALASDNIPAAPVDETPVDEQPAE